MQNVFEMRHNSISVLCMALPKSFHELIPALATTKLKAYLDSITAYVNRVNTPLKRVELTFLHDLRFVFYQSVSHIKKCNNESTKGLPPNFNF